jgi:hypothetical protein
MPPRTKVDVSNTASIADLLNKPRRHLELAIGGEPGPNGTIVNQRVIKLAAISAVEYDALMALHPPTAKQKDDGEGFNSETFSLAIIAAVVSEPKMSVAEVEQVWNSGSWSRGELRDLYFSCLNLCTQGLDVPFKPAG